MKKILVVEDEYYARKSIVKILQESGLVPYTPFDRHIERVV